MSEFERFINDAVEYYCSKCLSSNKDFESDLKGFVSYITQVYENYELQRLGGFYG